MKDKLLTEMPGILNLALRHLHNLLERGKFLQPESGANIAEMMGKPHIYIAHVLSGIGRLLVSLAEPIVKPVSLTALVRTFGFAWLL